MRSLVVILGLFWLASPISAQTLCDLSENGAIEEIAAGSWAGELNRAIESETVSRVTTDVPTRVTIERGSYGLTIDSAFLDGLREEPFALDAVAEPFDDEQVEEFLTGTRDDLVNEKLGERTCNAIVLPQLRAVLPKTDGMSASGAVTVIFYRPDLALQLTELTLESPETVIYATETVWLRKMAGNGLKSR